MDGSETVTNTSKESAPSVARKDSTNATAKNGAPIDLALAAVRGIDTTFQWIVDIGLSRHLVASLLQLQNSVERDEECLLSVGDAL